MTLAQNDIERQVALAIALPEAEPDTPHRSQVLIVAQTLAIGEALSTEMAQDAAVQGQVQTGTLSAALAEMAQGLGAVDVLVFEISDDFEADLSALHYLPRMPGNTPQIIAVGSSPLNEEHRQVLHEAGVQEVLNLSLKPQEETPQSAAPASEMNVPLPESEPELAVQTKTLPTQIRLPQPVSSADSAAAQPSLGDITVVLRARGGAGATTIAVNLAVTQACRAQPGSIALVDLDLQNGAVALSLDMLDSAEASDFVKGETDVDDDFLARAMVRHHSGVDVLTAPDVFAPLTALLPGRIDLLLEALQARYDHIVLDMPQSVVDWIEPVFARAARVLLVSDMSLPAIKRTRRLIDMIGEDHMNLPIQVVINLEKKTVFPTATQKEAAQLIGRSLEHWIPVDPRAARRASDTGVPMAIGAKRSSPAKAIGALVKAIYPTPARD